MNIDEIKANAEAFAARLVPQEQKKELTEEERKALLERKAEIEKEFKRMRARRYDGMDDDRAEDIVEDLYRELLEIEKKLAGII